MRRTWHGVALYQREGLDLIACGQKQSVLILMKAGSAVSSSPPSLAGNRQTCLIIQLWIKDATAGLCSAKRMRRDKSSSGSLQYTVGSEFAIFGGLYLWLIV